MVGQENEQREISAIADFLFKNARDNHHIAEAILACLAPFSRGSIDGHVTASAFVVDTDTKTALLIYHNGLGQWLQPGGHIDPGETPVQAALRELREETGVIGCLRTTAILDVDVHRIGQNPKKGEPEHYHLDVRFLMTADSNSLVEIEIDECGGYQWVPLRVLIEEGGNIGRMAMLSKKASTQEV